jgi:hypothetical protein
MITAPDMASLKKAEGLVRKLVTPVEENQNEHKRAQLRKAKQPEPVFKYFLCSSRLQLAEINGTLMGHEDSFAPSSSAASSSKRPQGCRNCQGAHPTYDCPSKVLPTANPTFRTQGFFLFCLQGGERVGVAGMSVRELMQREYAAFCRAVGEQEPEISNNDEVQAQLAMSSFYSELQK